MDADSKRSSDDWSKDRSSFPYVAIIIVSKAAELRHDGRLRIGASALHISHSENIHSNSKTLDRREIRRMIARDSEQ